MCLTIRWDGSGDPDEFGKTCESRQQAGLETVDYAHVYSVLPVTKWPAGHVKTRLGRAGERATAGEFIKRQEYWWDWRAAASSSTGLEVIGTAPQDHSFDLGAAPAPSSQASPSPPASTDGRTKCTDTCTLTVDPSASYYGSYGSTALYNPDQAYVYDPRATASAYDYPFHDSDGGGVASNGVCEDGGPGSEYAMCELGTDCADCGGPTGRRLEGGEVDQRGPSAERTEAILPQMNYSAAKWMAHGCEYDANDVKESQAGHRCPCPSKQALAGSSGGVCQEYDSGTCPACHPTKHYTAAIAYYAYGYPHMWSANTLRERENAVAMFTVLDEGGSWSLLYIVDKPWDGSGGSLYIGATGTGVANHDKMDYDADDDNGGKTGDDYYPIEVLLEDDHWDPNHYNWDGAEGCGTFYWNWLECCTDGMIMGYLPQANSNPVNPRWSLTFDWIPPGNSSADNTAYEWAVPIDDKHRMGSMSDGSKVFDAPRSRHDSTYFGIEEKASAQSIYDVWNTYPQAGYRYTNTDFRDNRVVKYDIMPHMTVMDKYKGVQLRYDNCHEYCSRFTSCGMCSGDMNCVWSGGSCSTTPTNGSYWPTAAYPFDAAANGGAIGFGNVCPICAAQTNEYDCLRHAGEPNGCGWAHFEKKCISGQPDYPSDHTVKLVQWQPPGLCYRVAYNQKKAFAKYKLMNEFGIYPITRWTASHPKVADGVCGGGTSGTAGATAAANELIPPETYWSINGTMDHSEADCELVKSGVAFYAYNYPFFASANPANTVWSSMYGRDAIKVYLVQDTDGITYMLMVVDRPYGRVGTLTMNMQTNAAEANVTFPDDPGAAFNSNWASGAWHSGGLLQPDTLTYEEVSSVGGRNQSWMFNWNWGGIDSDGMVFGPLAPQKPWQIDFQVIDAGSAGVNRLDVGSYSAVKGAAEFPNPIALKHTEETYGGVSIAGMSCTDYCQAYETCDECRSDERCQFARLNGGCVSALAYVPSNGCPAPPDPPERVYSNVEIPYAVGMTSLKLKIKRPDKLNWICPCVYTYYVVVYLAANPLEEIAYVKDVPVREYDRFSYTQISGLQPKTSYMVYVWICSQDECGTYPLIDMHTTNG